MSTSSIETSTPGTVEQLRADAGRYMFRVMARGKAHFHEALTGFEVAPPVAVALLHLNETMSMNELADRIGCDPSRITGIADGLEELGWVERQPWPEDRRVKQLVVTEKGQKAATEITRHVFDTHPIFDKLDKEELSALVAILDKALAED